MTSCIVAAVALSSSVFQSSAQPANERLAAMTKLKNFVGDWVGTGWQGIGERRVEFKSHETMVSQAGGVIFSITGKHWIEKAGEADQVIYEGFGTISFEPREKKYSLINTYSTGESVKYELELIEDGVLWQMGPNGYVTLTVKDGKWVEKAFQRGDGEPVQFFEITMTKKSGS